jgi:hypothetical protein
VTGEVSWTASPRLTNTFWERDGASHRQVLTWLTGGAAADADEAAFDRETREPVLELLATPSTRWSPRPEEYAQARRRGLRGPARRQVVVTPAPA